MQKARGPGTQQSAWAGVEGGAPAGSLALVLGYEPTNPQNPLPSPARPSDLGVSYLNPGIKLPPVTRFLPRQHTEDTQGGAAAAPSFQLARSP
jgi:hypothetical protein